MSTLLEPLASSQWDRAKARHLLRRAGFGIPLSRVDLLTEAGPQYAVAYFVDTERQADNFPDPDWLEQAGAMRKKYREMRMESSRDPRAPARSAEERRKLEEERQKAVAELRRQERQNIQRLKYWWVNRMQTTARPLQEKMSLFWHGHFAVSAQKVQSSYANYDLNRLFRDRGLGNFKMLTYEVGCSPAMMRYLDNARNSKRNPNENWARELMELFTIGPGHYSEADIKNSARAFTGWTTDDGDFVYNPRDHDNGEKIFMGRIGNLNGNDIIDIIFEQEATAEFIVRKLWTFFAYADPEDEIVEGLARRLRGAGYELRPMLSEMFRSRAFYSDKAMWTQIKSPVQLLLSNLSHLDIEPGQLPMNFVLQALRRMGQDLFYPPSVKGWDGGEAWINTNTLMNRYNLAAYLLDRNGPNRRRRGNPPRREAPTPLEAGQRDGRPGPGRSNDRGMTDESRMDSSMAREGRGGPNRNRSPFHPREYFARWNGLPLNEVVDRLADLFYGHPLGEVQRREIIATLGGAWTPAAPFNAQSTDLDRLRATVHLMLSTAEFQLC